ARSAWEHSNVYLHHRRQSARRKHLGRPAFGARRVLRNGPRLRGFRPPPRLHRELGVLRDAHQKEPGISAPCVPSGTRRDTGSAVQSNVLPKRSGASKSVPRSLATHHLRRSKNTKTTKIPNQKFCSPRRHHCTDL